MHTIKFHQGFVTQCLQDIDHENPVLESIKGKIGESIENGIKPKESPEKSRLSEFYDLLVLFSLIGFVIFSVHLRSWLPFISFLMINLIVCLCWGLLSSLFRVVEILEQPSYEISLSEVEAQWFAYFQKIEKSLNELGLNPYQFKQFIRTPTGYTKLNGLFQYRDSTKFSKILELCFVEEYASLKFSHQINQYADVLLEWAVMKWKWTAVLGIPF